MRANTFLAGVCWSLLSVAAAVGSKHDRHDLGPGHRFSESPDTWRHRFCDVAEPARRAGDGFLGQRRFHSGAAAFRDLHGEVRSHRVPASGTHCGGRTDTGGSARGRHGPCSGLRNGQRRWGNDGRCADANRAGGDKFRSGSDDDSADQQGHQSGHADGAGRAPDGTEREFFRRGVDVVRKPVHGERGQRERESARPAERSHHRRRGSGDGCRDRRCVCRIRTVWRRRD